MTARWCAIWNFRAALCLCRRHRDRPGRLALDSYGDADAIITNPPYTRELMHKLIAHFQRIAPTWLLIDFGLVGTKQAAPFMPHLHGHRIFGRLQWFEGTKEAASITMPGIDSTHALAGPIFHARGSAPVPSRVSLCAQCGAPYRPQRSDSRFCSDTCRQRAHRGRLAVTKRDTRPRAIVTSWASISRVHGARRGDSRCMTTDGAALSAADRSSGLAELRTVTTRRGTRSRPVLGCELQNLKPICQPCHAKVEAGERRSLKPMASLDGTPGGDHPWN